LLCFGLNPDMTTSTQKPSTWKTTIKAVKEEPSLLGVFLFSIALIATGILPIWLDASPSLAKWIDGCRWGAVGLFFSTLIAIFAKFTTTNEKIQVMQDSVEGRIEEVASRVITVEGHLQRERLIELPSTSYLTTLRQLMSDARKRVMLMYFVKNPPGDTSTEEYWRWFVELLLKRADQPVEFRRIATIGSTQKLKAILANNAALFKSCKKGESSRISYRLAYYPNPEIKPPQADIVDDAIMLFSPYSGSSSQDRVWTRNVALVENFAEYYEGLWQFLQSRGHVILDFPDRDESKYKDEEVIQYMSVARAIHVSDEKALFAEYIEPHTSLKFPAVMDRLRTNPASTSL